MYGRSSFDDDDVKKFNRKKSILDKRQTEEIFLSHASVSREFSLSLSVLSSEGREKKIPLEKDRWYARCNLFFD